MIMIQIFLTSKLNNSMLLGYKNTNAKHMIKRTVLTLTTLLASSTAFAAIPPKPEEIKESSNIVVTPSIAYRYDVFRWSICDKYFKNKKRSELIWKNHIIQPGIKIEIEPQTNEVTFLGQTKYGYILKKPSESWDYDWQVYKDTTGNIISEPESKTKSLATGNILDLSGAVGYSINLFNNNLLTFYVGYDYTDYKNKNYGVYQRVNNSNDLLHNFNQIVAKYYFKTQSPWLGLSVNTPITDRFRVVPTIKFYSFNYVGKGYWLLRDDLQQNPSFKDNAKGNGFGLDVDFLYKYSDSLDFKINLETKKFKMKKGKQQTFEAADIRGPAVVTTSKLFALNLISSSTSIGFRYKF